MTFVARRILIGLPTLLGAFLLIFSIPRLVPGDPVALVMRDNYTQSNYDAVEHQLGLDRPVTTQFFVALGNALRGDFGQSFYNRRPVAANVGSQIPHTVSLALAALLVAVGVGIPAGAIAATKRNSGADLATMVLSLLALSAPSFWLGIIFILTFSLGLGWLPSSGLGTPGNVPSTLSHLVLPALVLGLSSAGVLARLTRSAMLQVLSEDYVRTAKAFGFHPRRVIFRHALRNALLPVVTVVGIEASKLLTGTVVIEVVFARAGLGRTLVHAIVARDYPQVQGVLILYVTVAIVMNIFIDVAYGWIDPRIRYD
jgi:ABC-type dipeptide/oligopeptide/nickel transport system permease component